MVDDREAAERNAQAVPAGRVPGERSQQRDRELLHEPQRLAKPPRLMEVDRAPEAEAERRCRDPERDLRRGAAAEVDAPEGERGDNADLHQYPE